MAGLAPRTRWPEPRRGPPGRVADPGRAASTGRVPSCIGRTSDPRRAAGPRPVPGPRPDRRLTRRPCSAAPSPTPSEKTCGTGGKCCCLMPLVAEAMRWHEEDCSGVSVWCGWGSWGDPGRGRVQICHKGAPGQDRRRTEARNINDSLPAFRLGRGLCGRFGQPAPPRTGRGRAVARLGEVHDVGVGAGIRAEGGRRPGGHPIRPRRPRPSASAGPAQAPRSARSPLNPRERTSSRRSRGLPGDLARQGGVRAVWAVLPRGRRGRTGRPPGPRPPSVRVSAPTPTSWTSPRRATALPRPVRGGVGCPNLPQRPRPSRNAGRESLIFRASVRRRFRRGAPLWQIWTRPRPGSPQEPHPPHADTPE